MLKTKVIAVNIDILCFLCNQESIPYSKFIIQATVQTNTVCCKNCKCAETSCSRNEVQLSSSITPLPVLLTIRFMYYKTISEKHTPKCGFVSRIFHEGGVSRRSYLLSFLWFLSPVFYLCYEVLTKALKHSIKKQEGSS